MTAACLYISSSIGGNAERNVKRISSSLINTNVTCRGQRRWHENISPLSSRQCEMIFKRANKCLPPQSIWPWYQMRSSTNVLEREIKWKPIKRERFEGTAAKNQSADETSTSRFEVNSCEHYARQCTAFPSCRHYYSRSACRLIKRRPVLTR